MTTIRPIHTIIEKMINETVGSNDISKQLLFIQEIKNKLQLSLIEYKDYLETVPCNRTLEGCLFDHVYIEIDDLTCHLSAIADKMESLEADISNGAYTID